MWLSRHAWKARSRPDIGVWDVKFVVVVGVSHRKSLMRHCGFEGITATFCTVQCGYTCLSSQCYEGIMKWKRISNLLYSPIEAISYLAVDVKAMYMSILPFYCAFPLFQTFACSARFHHIILDPSILLRLSKIPTLTKTLISTLQSLVFAFTSDTP